MSVYESIVKGLNEAVEYEKALFLQKINSKIADSEKQIEEGNVLNAEDALEKLRDKNSGCRDLR